MDFFKSAVASAISKAPPFPYSFGDKVTLGSSIWTLYNGTKREDNSECSIFSFDVVADKARMPLARNAVRKMRTLRHPGVIKVLDTVETESYIYVATERVVPLEWPVRRNSLSEETLKWGLYNIANTLSFINDEAKSIHGSLRLSSVFISRSGEWRLAGFEVLSSMTDDEAVIYTFGSLVPDSGRYAPPEVAKSDWHTVKCQPVPAVDSYNYGLLLLAIFNGGAFSSDQIGQTKNIPPSMQQSYKKLLNPSPKARLSVSHFRVQGRRRGGFFETPLIKLSEGIESLGLKSDNEKEEFLSELDEVEDDFPEEYFSVKVLPELLKAVEYGGGGSKVFTSVMKIGAKLSDEDYNTRVTPVIVRLFSNPDRAIRVCLLESLPSMIDRLSQKIVTDKIFPQIVTGFTDLAPLVREQTVKAVLTIITKLSDRVINGDLLKHLAKTSNDEQPGIRTNTTICLGKIARNLGANTRQKVLIAAFSRSLRDPFIHARNASLQALAATSDLFSDEDCALRILPVLCSSLIDKEKLVRDQANKTFDIYVQRTRKYGASLPDTALTPASTGPANGVPRMGTPQSDTSWAGWAISSFTNKLATASGEMQSKPIPQAPRTILTNGRSSSTPPVADTIRPAFTASSASNLHKQALSRPSAPILTRTSTDQFFNDAQDEDDEVDDSFFDAPTETAEPTPTPFDDGGEPDFEGWLNAQANAKSKPRGPLPKGLAKPSSATGNGRPPAVKSKTTGSVGSGAGTKKLATPVIKPKMVPSKVIDTKPKEEDVGDEWGDAWE